MSARIYFDNAATTPVDPRVAQAMEPYWRQAFGNPSSLYREGRESRGAVERARSQVAALLHARPEEIVFTASGTEASNMALVGVAEACGADCHMITSAIEHPAVLETCRYLQRRGVAITQLPVTPEGIVEPAALIDALRPTTRLVSVMAANNAVGTLQPLAELARITREHGALFHTDAVQAVGKIPVNVQTQAIDLLSLSAHKLHGPKGVGALYVREGVAIEPLVHGGGQEQGRRSATENVAGIVGLGEAARLAQAAMSDEAVRLVRLRDRIIDAICREIPNAYLLGDRYQRLPGHVCLGLAGQEAEAIKLLLALDELGIAIASGSACSANHAGQPSHVLVAMGRDPVHARGSLRITLGRFNTEAEVDRLLEVLPRVAASLRPMTTRTFASA
ncbi:MAG: cysteine desulfurase family protein [Thermoguttaceae bacterium]|jgi:cysteine desulfurase